MPSPGLLSIKENILSYISITEKTLMQTPIYSDDIDMQWPL